MVYLGTMSRSSFGDRHFSCAPGARTLTRFYTVSCGCDRHNKNTTEAAITRTAAANLNVFCTPNTNVSAGASVIIALEDCTDTIPAKMAPNNGTPVVCPSVRVRDSKPEAMPSGSGGTDPNALPSLLWDNNRVECCKPFAGLCLDKDNLPKP